MTMRGLATQIDRQEAVRRLVGRRLLGRGRLPAHVELLWMPFFLVSLELGSGAIRRRVRVLVDGRSGTAVRLAGDVVWQAVPEMSSTPLLTEGEAALRARALLRRGILFLRRIPPAGLEVVGHRVEMVAYPFWMQVFERRRHRYDIRLLDAVGGRPAGAEAKRSALEALVEEARLSAGSRSTSLVEARP